MLGHVGRVGLGKVKGKREAFAGLRRAVWWGEKYPALGLRKREFKAYLATNGQVANALTISACEEARWGSSASFVLCTQPPKYSLSSSGFSQGLPGSLCQNLTSSIGVTLGPVGAGKRLTCPELGLRKEPVSAPGQYRY